jgi:hypothetical protein
MKRTLRCPSCEQRIRVSVPEPRETDWGGVAIVVCMVGFFIVCPLVLAALGIWGTR